MKRREFLACIGLVLSTVALSLAGSACKSSTTPSDSAASQTFTSTSVQSHTHTITIFKVDFDTPPARGISRQTSTSGGHSHTFSMTMDQLISVKNGASLQIETGVDSGHSHTFTVAKWF